MLVNALRFSETVIGAAATATGSPGLAAVREAVGVVRNAAELRRIIRDQGLNDLASRLAGEAEERAKDWARSPDHAAAAGDAAALFDQALDHVVPRPEDLVGEALDAERVMGLMLGRLTVPDCPLRHDFAHGRPARAFFEAVALPALRSLLADRRFVEELGPAFCRGVLERLGRIEADTQAIIAGQTLASNEREADRTEFRAFMNEVRASGIFSRAQASGVPEQAVIELARRIAPHVATIEQAMAELERAIQVAIRVQEEGRHGSNLGTFIDEVMRQTADLSASGEFKAVSESLDRALWEIDTRAEEIRAGKFRLLDSHIANDRLRRDPAAAARHVIARLANDGRHSSAEIFAAFVEWREAGLRAPLIFDLEVSIPLAGEALTRSRDTFERAHIQENIGQVRETLGHRLLRRDLYDAAHEDFQAAAVAFNHPLTQDRRVVALHHGLQNRSSAAVLEREHKELPRIAAAMERLLHEARPWPRIEAAIWSALGTTLVELGCHERETINPRVAKPRFEKAIGCYEASLRLVRKDQDRQKWARDVQNLGRALFEAERYEEALGQYRQALRTKSRRAAPLSWGVTVFNIAAAWAGVAQRDWSEAAFLKARCWARIALRVRSRDASRKDWALTTRLLGMLEAQRRQMTGDTALGDEARRLLTEVRPVLEEFQSPRELAEVDHILARLGALSAP